MTTILPLVSFISEIRHMETSTWVLPSCPFLIFKNSVYCKHSAAIKNKGLFTSDVEIEADKTAYYVVHIRQLK